jgi:RNA polymerase sigma-70 factor (ECF subfamily)
MDTKNIWTEYHTNLERFIASKVKDEQVTKDILQEVFIKVHTKIEQLTDSTKLKSWLFSIARNAVMDYFKSISNTQELTHEELAPEVEGSNSHSEQDCLSGIINHLPNKYKRPLYLANIKGVKQSDIAQKLNLPLPTVKSQIQRGRKLILEGYMDCCDYKLDSKGKLVGEHKEKAECKMCD